MNSDDLGNSTLFWVVCLAVLMLYLFYPALRDYMRNGISFYQMAVIDQDRKVAYIQSFICYCKKHNRLSPDDDLQFATHKLSHLIFEVDVPLLAEMVFKLRHEQQGVSK